jgi:hypothetical protein
MTGGMGGEGGMMPVDGGDTDAMTGGSGGTEPMDPGYVACTVASAATDCGADAECRESDPPLLGEALFVCAPECTMESDCPAAPAGGDATLACTDGHCVLSCDLFAANCPTGMTCAAKGVDATCYIDGM